MALDKIIIIIIIFAGLLLCSSQIRMVVFKRGK